jgi:hypothetical protein
MPPDDTSAPGQYTTPTGRRATILRARRRIALRERNLARMHAAKRAPFPAFCVGDVGVLDPCLGYVRRAASIPRSSTSSLRSSAPHESVL